ncbi:hypothetical protein N9O57_00005, partial [bacterium]|nr:hypothetical protein [bacterium]
MQSLSDVKYNESNELNLENIYIRTDDLTLSPSQYSQVKNGLRSLAQIIPQNSSLTCYVSAEDASFIAKIITVSPTIEFELNNKNESLVDLFKALKKQLHLDSLEWKKARFADLKLGS